MDFLFPDKNAPVILSRHLRNLIQLIGETKTKEHEQKIIINEIQKVKQQIHHHINPDDYPDIMVKLIYFQTMGYNTSFARIIPINLCQSQSPYLKKISYLLAAMLVKPGQKLAILMHNTIIKDLQSQNIFTNMTVLTMLRYFINEDIASDIIPIIRRMLKHKLSLIRRKSLFVIYNIYKIYPYLIQDIKQIILYGFNDQEVPVMFGSLNILRQVIEDQVNQFKNIVSKIVDIFGKIMDHKYPAEYDYHKLPAPWIQMDILKILEKLGKNDQNTSKLMYECLSKCMKKSQNIYMHFNKGILQQCIKTISNIYPNDTLLIECEQSLHTFFSQGNNNNVRSFGLAAMTHLAKGRPQVLVSWKMFLIDCLLSDDITLAERTIGLLIQIANEQNTEIILDRIIVLGERSTDAAEKRKLIKNSIYLIERFSNKREIFLRRMNQIFYKFQEFVSDGSINNFLKTLQEMVEIDKQFIDMILQNFRNNTLVKVAVWIIGQMTHKIYLRDKNSQIVDRSIQALLSCADQYLLNSTIILNFVISLMKLSEIQMTSKHQKIKQFLLKVQSQIPFQIHKCGQEFIRVAKYSKALYGANQLIFDNKMKFLGEYLQNTTLPVQKKYMITKKSQKLQINDLDLLSSDVVKKQVNNSNIFEFKPGHRWGTINQEKAQNTKVQNKNNQKNNENNINKQGVIENKMILRGPHQQKKTKPTMDQKKIKLANSIFGKKN